MGLFDRKPNEDDRTVFVEEILELLDPHIDEILREDRSDDLLAEGRCRFLDRIHRRLLGRFYDLAKAEPAVGKFMMPVMMYLRRSRAGRLSGKQ